MNEIWKDIPGYEGYYQASCLGRIRSLQRKLIHIDGMQRLYPGRILINSLRNLKKLSTKYLCVGLNKNNNQKTFHVHELVSLTFLGNRPIDYEIHHKDGDSYNNNINNLKYITRRDHMSGEMNGQCKISDDDVANIRILYSKGNVTQVQIAQKYNIDQSHVSRILSYQHRPILTFSERIEK